MTIDLTELIQEYKIMNILNLDVVGFTLFHKPCGRSFKPLRDTELEDIVHIAIIHNEDCNVRSTSSH